VTRIKTILHPTDFSENASHAYQLACALARDYGAKLLLVHVRPIPAIVPTELGTIPPPSEENDEGRRARLEAIRPEDANIACERHLLAGDEAEEIIALAQRMSADLIVMGTHGRTGLNRLLMGSVAESVVRRAPCPVLTMKYPAPGV
jgi:nucleotide-binding universal stress UspA family protein